MPTLSVSAPDRAATASTRAGVNVPMGYLRAFVTALVIVHHTLLGYHPFAPPPNATLLADPRLWPAFPVVDAQRSMAASLIVGFNEAFFMSLMFLLSGLFAWQSIQRRGAAAFIRTRVLRLGLPFARPRRGQLRRDHPRAEPGRLRRPALRRMGRQRHGPRTRRPRSLRFRQTTGLRTQRQSVRRGVC